MDASESDKYQEFLKMYNGGGGGGSSYVLLINGASSIKIPFFTVNILLTYTVTIRYFLDATKLELKGVIVFY